VEPLILVGQRRLLVIFFLILLDLFLDVARSSEASPPVRLMSGRCRASIARCRWKEVLPWLHGRSWRYNCPRGCHVASARILMPDPRAVGRFLDGVRLFLVLALQKAKEVATNKGSIGEEEVWLERTMTT
jgi:hypothetical protein